MKNTSSRLKLITFLTTIVIAGTIFHSVPLQGQSDHEDHDSRIERGIDIAPVPLNLAGKDRALVGLGSYLVNAAADCNGCHSAGPQTQFVPGGNPFGSEQEFVGGAEKQPF